ncbi:hypothetical protein BDK51DRAFT_27645 [Blyttiomyces helicus]|uniref:Uncharacterized protein n=1 Tax=Blyttiomyces helicus TaxID=388810 RepID=A0A4P9W8U0_9FUNG|nr:hypothetical protein BDK51DRAFT_27645 [Blyttiomyces helicus]|eukprot:RKO88951.1 hypothetical protein BDK51DRAFT_27645 [Blyttiomyces helicus]
MASKDRSVVLDSLSRERAHLRRLDELERDNFVVIPEPDPTLSSRKATMRNLESDEAGGSKKGRKSAVRKLLVQRKSLAVLIQESRIGEQPPDVPTYLTVAVGPSKFPARKFCSVCGYPFLPMQSMFSRTPQEPVSKRNTPFP